MRASPVFVHAANAAFVEEKKAKKATLYITKELGDDLGEVFASDAKKIHDLFMSNLPAETLKELRGIMSGLSHFSTEMIRRELNRREKEEQWRKYPEHRKMMAYNGTRGDMIILQAIENRISRGYFGESEEQRGHDRQFLWERGIDIQFLEIEKRTMLTTERE